MVLLHTFLVLFVKFQILVKLTYFFLNSVCHTIDNAEAN